LLIRAVHKLCKTVHNWKDVLNMILPPLPDFMLLSLTVLLLTALWDAKYGVLPDTPLALTGWLVLAARLTQEGLPVITDLTLIAMLATILYGANELFYRLSGRDGFGMGDVKWTMLAALAFGITPALWAWLIGAWWALGWMGARRMLGHPTPHVHFGPFLFLGLISYLAILTGSFLSDI
jgi:prepilin signal peptidase PulO-like enzyme (type II secretory pathway)